MCVSVCVLVQIFQVHERKKDFSPLASFWYSMELNKHEGMNDQLHRHNLKLRSLFQIHLPLEFLQHLHSTPQGLSKHWVLVYILSFSHPDCPSFPNTNHPQGASSVPGDAVGLSLALSSQKLELSTEQDPWQDPT